MRILVPIDGSDASLAALDSLLDRAGWFATPLDLHLLNVQRRLSQDISRFVGTDALHELHREQGMACLKAARERVEARGQACRCHVVVGEAADCIVQFARQEHCEQIALGARGLGALPGLMLGSVTTRVLQLSEVPVLVLK